MSALEYPVSTVPDLLDPNLGMFGKYRLLRRLAAGGMAHVYLASIDGPDGFSKTCVVKRILPEYASSSDFNKMFVTEAKVAALLNHPNIVQTFDFGKFGEQYYLAMEWVAGGSVDTILRQAVKKNVTLGPKTAVLIGIPILEALSYLESATLPDLTPLNLVHRDVTPGNILVSNIGVVKLTDFGVVKTNANPGQTVAGVLKGKYSYMSPEQALNKSLDHRSDLFSLGVCLYEIATGRRLFKRESLAATLDAVTHATVPPPSQSSPDFPVQLERILMKALTLHREDRYQCARDMLADLERFRTTSQWTQSSRELAALMQGLFPGGIATAIPPGVSSLQSALLPLDRDGTGASTVALDPDEDPLPAVDIEDVSPMSARTFALMTGAALAASAVFWWLILR